MNWGAVWLVAGAVALGAPYANAQSIVRGPGVIVASDIDAPYDEIGPPLPPRYAPGPYSGGPTYAPPPPYAAEVEGPGPYGAPMLLPPGEIIRIARRNGFSPLGDPQQRGPVYRIAVISPDGDDGRLVIDARTGRIIRFWPAGEFGSRFERGRAYADAPVSALPPMADTSRASLRPPASVPPRVAAPTTIAALPKSASSSASPASTSRRRADLHASVPPAPPAALATAPPQPLAAAGSAAKPPTEMPPAQGLD